MKIEQEEILIEKNGVFKITDRPAVLTAYLQDSKEGMKVRRRPAVLICPGGGYERCSFREGEPVALELLAKGYQAFVLEYSTGPDSFPAALLEAAGAMALIRLQADRWEVEGGRAAVLGFSAGGHLAASLAVFWNQKFLSSLVKGQVAFAGRGGRGEGKRLPFSQADLSDLSLIIRPDRLLLSYPVITSGPYSHRGSIDVLLGNREGEEREELLKLLSLEDQVGPHVPPVFLWHTFSDDTVPVENSLVFLNALRKAGVETEAHLFPEGRHGLALADWRTEKAEDDGRGPMNVPSCQPWLSLMEGFLDRWRSDGCGEGSEP